MRTLFGVFACTLAACSSLDSFEADAAHPYVGVVLGEDTSCDAGVDCSYLRRGFRAGTELELTFDPDAVSTSPGTLTTKAGGGGPEACATTFDAEPLRAIEPLAHDALSQLTFPGDGRLRTFVYALSPSAGPLAGRDAYAFVSLMRDDSIEVRVLAGSGARACLPTDCARYLAGDCDYFGVFRLKRRDEP